MKCINCGYTNLIFNKICDKCRYPLADVSKEEVESNKVENLQKIIEEGTEINDYTFGKLIGVGGFGQVYKGRSKTLKRDVAIKVYSIKNDQLLYAFHRGANMISQLNHPNIVTIFDYFIEEEMNIAIIVMELLNPNETLRKYVSNFNSQEKINIAIKWFEEMVSTLRFCHQKKYETLRGVNRIGIFHGDIKPDNIFIHYDKIKLGDFMIPDLEQVIKTLEQGYTFNMHATMAFGTPNYMSEEQEVHGEVNEMTDIYSLGITIYELLTGFYPYDNYNPNRKNPKPAKLYNPHVPDWLDRIILKCIDNDQGNRYKKMAEVEIDLINREKTQMQDKYRILFLGANPTASPLRLDEEVREIHTNIKLSKERDKLELIQEWAVTPQNLIQSVLDNSPKIIHFSGHGQSEGIILEDNSGSPKIITGEALAELFDLFKDNIECVVLNSCYSEEQALAIKQKIPFVIGMNTAIPDKAAIAFSVGFYKGIGAGKSIPFSFKLGITAIMLEGIKGEKIPKLV